MLTNENYFSTEMNRQYVGSSQFKSFMECPHSALAELEGAYQAPKSEALLMGGYMDAYFEGTLEAYEKANPEIFNSRKPGELKANYQQVNAIIKRVERDPYFMEMMSGAKQVIFTGEIAGVPVKVKVDSMHSDKVVDLKLIKDFQSIWKDGRKQPWQEAWGYDIQAAMYREIVRQNTGETLPFFIAAATKEKVTDYNVFKFLDADLDNALEYIKQNIEYVQSVKEGIFPATRCDKCDYCKETKVLTGYSLFEDIEI